MKAIKEYDEIIEGFESGRKKFDRHEVDNFILFDAYYKSIHINKNEVIDFGGILFEGDVPSLVDAMLAHEIRDFTLSTSQSYLQDLIAAFMDCADGAYITGMALVRTGWVDPFEGEEVKYNAIAMHLVDIDRF